MNAREAAAGAATAGERGKGSDGSGPAGSGGDSLFEASSFERSISTDAPRRWMRWHRRALALAALLGCLGLFSLARWLATAPVLPVPMEAGAGGTLVIGASSEPAFAPLRGRTVLAVRAADGSRVPVDAALLHGAPRWQPDDALRARQVAQQEALAALLARAGGSVELQLDDGGSVRTKVVPRELSGLGYGFWPLAGLSLLLYLLGLVLLLARPQPRTLLFVLMTLAEAASLLLLAAGAGRGIGAHVGAAAADMPWRGALDLCVGAVAVQLYALHPRRLRQARLVAALGWLPVLAWAALAFGAGTGAGSGVAAGPPLWWLLQGGNIALCAAALALAGHSRRVEPNPYALVMWRLAGATLAAAVLVTAVVALASRAQGPAGSVAVTAGAVAWTLFIALLLMLTPLLARSRQVLREFALLAGVSTVATSLDLLFVAVFSLGTFTSLAMAVFIGLGLYAGARQWLLNHLIGTSVLTTERTFEQLYRAARELQARPARHPQLLTQLLRDLFEPLDVLRVDRVPVRSRVVSGGSALVVPMRTPDDSGAALPATALVLRFAQRGRRLFTLDDARLADRVVEQLRRAVAYDRAVERGRAEERQRIAQDLHDDIGARLLTLMYQAQTPEMEDYIRHTLLDLKTLTRGLAASEHRLSHAAAEWKSDLTQRLTAAHVELGWSFTSDRDLRLSVVQWSALTRVLRELVSNALYHGNATRVDVSFVLDGPLLKLQVADDGEGRNPQAWSHGLGLGGVRKRVKILGGEVAWAENGERGIACTVRVADFQGRG